eukprot:CAMPEP_0174364396 /NCGR_PEP_ID=MMETSP0811_2-20130205/72688_1 /TAXON_ID=73025 ORGANISM="Eutreptiella gymnastica-like, Strain CCMP1594" /NCGR_SAMPLE_ID=MMETSP0811_2 /ASSEMBLY_ACC=CAM_ASM_000667 /LENGTH=175 /DNA_ID=CAMNT_0015503961 /DNA_START=62 /DNA_END=586 /DNA_ORIENTATION=-
MTLSPATTAAAPTLPAPHAQSWSQGAGPAALHFECGKCRNCATLRCGVYHDWLPVPCTCHPLPIGRWPYGHSACPRVMAPLVPVQMRTLGRWGIDKTLAAAYRCIQKMHQDVGGVHNSKKWQWLVGSFLLSSNCVQPIAPQFGALEELRISDTGGCQLLIQNAEAFHMWMHPCSM